MIQWRLPIGFCRMGSIRKLVSLHAEVLARGKTTILCRLGYTWANFDDCIVWDRNSTGYLVEDPQAFPFGAKNTSLRLNQLGYKMGWYTDRGNFTCSCYAGGKKRPGRSEKRHCSVALVSAYKYHGAVSAMRRKMQSGTRPMEFVRSQLPSTPNANSSF
jgi:hypothetical protein